MKRLLLVLILFVFYSSFVVAAEPLPMAPKRYDNRDELPAPGFNSITGEDPLPPGEKRKPASVIENKSKIPSKKVVNNKKTTASKKPLNTAVKGKVKTKPNAVASKKTAAPSKRTPSSNKSTTKKSTPAKKDKKSGK